MINAAGGPSNLQPSDPNNQYPGLTNFSLHTHGFGNPVVNTSLGVLQNYLQELLAYYEGRKPIHVPEKRYNVMDSRSSQSLDGMGTGMSTESIPMPHGNGSQQNSITSTGVQQNPLLYATRHYPGGSKEGEEDQETTSNGNEREVIIEVSMKEEPVDSPTTFTI